MKVICASPNCKYASEKEDISSVIFISFPNNEISKIWAQNCGRPDLMLKPSEDLHMKYFICSHHFEDHFFISKDNPMIMAQETVPTLFNERKKEIDNVDSNKLLLFSYKNENHNLSTKASTLCRICGSELINEGIEIFNTKQDNLLLIDKMNLLLPISPNIDDKMPQKLCMDCFEKIETFYKLVVSSIQTDIRLRKYLNLKKTPFYDIKFNKIFQECSLELANEIMPNTNVVQKAHNFESNPQTNIIPFTVQLCNLQLNEDCNTQLNNNNRFLPPIKVIINTQNNKNNININSVCNYCKNSFQTKEMYEEHKLLCSYRNVDSTNDANHSTQNLDNNDIYNINLSSFNCSNCDQTFSTKTLFEKHKLTHTGNNLQTSSKQDMQRKKYLNRFKVQKRCGHCQVAYDTKNKLQIHISEMHNGINLLQCELCSKKFSEWRDLETHEKSHKLDELQFCDRCGRCFKDFDSLRDHKRIHLAKSITYQHICKLCPKKFRSRFHLTEHINEHTDNKPYSCQECDKSFHKMIQLKQHSSSHSESKFICPMCNISFTRKANMDIHLKRHSKADKLYTCTICDQEYSSMRDLKIHRKEHSENDIIDSIKRKSKNITTIWQCENCKKIFSKRTYLMAHEKVHSENKVAIECNECSKKFSSKNALLHHKQSIHLQERKHLCHYCGESFIFKNACLTHERKHTGERPYICKFCNMQYRCSSSLNQHLKTHSDQRPHVCQYCNKGFARRGVLTIHERIHTGEKPYSCMVCSKSFTQKNDMIKHSKTHQNKTVQCEQCNENFETKKEILKHLAEHKSIKMTLQTSQYSFTKN